MPGSLYGHLRQAVGQPFYDFDAGHFSRRGKDSPQYDCSLNVVSARALCVLWFGFGKDAGFLCYISPRKNSIVIRVIACRGCRFSATDILVGTRI